MRTKTSILVQGMWYHRLRTPFNHNHDPKTPSKVDPANQTVLTLHIYLKGT